MSHRGVNFEGPSAQIRWAGCCAASTLDVIHERCLSVGSARRCHLCMPSTDAIHGCHPPTCAVYGCHPQIPSTGAVQQWRFQGPSTDAIHKCHPRMPSTFAINPQMPSDAFRGCSPQMPPTDAIRGCHPSMPSTFCFSMDTIRRYRAWMASTDAHERMALTDETVSCPVVRRARILPLSSVLQLRSNVLRVSFCAPAD